MNTVGIDVSKGKSTVSILRPFVEIVYSPFDVNHGGAIVHLISPISLGGQATT